MHWPVSWLIATTGHGEFDRGRPFVVCKCAQGPRLGRLWVVELMMANCSCERASAVLLKSQGHRKLVAHRPRGRPGWVVGLIGVVKIKSNPFFQPPPRTRSGRRQSIKCPTAAWTKRFIIIMMYETSTEQT